MLQVQYRHRNEIRRITYRRIIESFLYEEAALSAVLMISELVLFGSRFFVYLNQE